MRWPTVIFGAVPASILAFPAALALLLGIGLFQPEKPITWIFIFSGAAGWIGMISLWIAARRRPLGKRTAIGLALGWMIMIVMSGALVG